jgi:hypothetical protein
MKVQGRRAIRLVSPMPRTLIEPESSPFQRNADEDDQKKAW